jgi:glycosyltransferase involved in cell wall biosynthesis
VKVGILVVAYNAETTLVDVLERIPAELRRDVAEVLVQDDHSTDDTFAVAAAYLERGTDLPLTVLRHPANLGYGGNQKAGYEYAIRHGWDVVVLLHGDGQYAPEVMDRLIRPIVDGEADAVFGSRMMTRGEARRGGMPLYKYVGNRILTTAQNGLTGAQLSEWHSGYRAYRVAALADLPFRANSDGFDFDTEIILELLAADKQILEVPIPTYYGDEICYVDCVKYAKDITRDVLRYRAHKMGFGTGSMAFASSAYDVKEGADTSHRRILAWMEARPPSRVLDLGCSDGELGGRLVAMGHEVVGVDDQEHKGVRSRLTDFVQADLDQGIPAEAGTGFDLVLAADVLEHVRHPERLLDDTRQVLRPGGTVITSVPNFGHWYPRARVALGRFDYDARGILDRGHVRFFTKRSFGALVRNAGWEVRRSESIGLPLEVVERGGHEGGGRGRSLVSRVDRAAIGLRPQLFAYQFLYELAPASSR